MVEAVQSFETDHVSDGVEQLMSVPSGAMIAMAERHGLGGYFYNACRKGRETGAAVSAELFEGFRRGWIAAALLAPAVSRRARSVASILREADIRGILLKGGARLALDRPDADLYLSTDVDVLVHTHDADAAITALRRANYSERVGAREIRSYVTRAHHRAPMWFGDEDVPIELHTSLCLPQTSSEPLGYDDLERLSRSTERGGEDIRAFDEVGSALHLAYHGRDFEVFRDVVILSQHLAKLNAADRAQFDELVQRESLDRIRLVSCVAVADALRCVGSPPDRATISYISWVIAREGMSDRLRKRTRFFEAAIARSRAPIRQRAHPLAGLHRIVFDAVAAPLVLYSLRRRVTTETLARRLFHRNEALA
jgi:hypothetical protein